MTDPYREAWIADNPAPLLVAEVDGETGETEERELTPQEYEARADAGAHAYAHQANQQAVVDADAAEGKTIMDKVTALETTADRLDSAEVLTQAQQRHFNAEHMRVTASVMRYLNKHSANPIPEEP